MNPDIDFINEKLSYYEFLFFLSSLYNKKPYNNQTFFLSTEIFSYDYF